MHYILNIETATRNCSVSLAANGKTISSREVAEVGYSHAEKLHVFIEEVLAEASIKPNQLAAIAVSHGPGSYTGLRIGVSSAKGLCYALQIPLISTSTLTALANQANVDNGVIVPMIDARRMEVYSAIFSASGETTREVMAEVLTPDSFSEINDTIYIVGDCTEKCKTVLTETKFQFLEDIQFPSALQMSEVSYQKFIGGQFEDVAYFEPFYLKDFLITTSKK